MLATLMRLSAEMHTRWARNGLTAAEAATVIVSRADLCSITGRTSYRRAMDLMRAAILL